ncbi:MAG: AIR synthase family protein [Candidatus Helarchaeota archaeon]
MRRIKFTSAGKIPNKILKEIVFKHLGSSNDRIIYGPGIGRDAAAVKSNGKILVIKSDPITGTIKNIGRYSVIINSNDIVTLGASPIFFLSTILLPLNSSLKDLETICKDIDVTAKDLGISVIGGHSEITKGVNQPVICGSLLGETTQESIIIANSKPGDMLIMTKSAAIEGTAILAWEREDYLKNKIDEKTLTNAKKFLNSLSILKDAQIAQQNGGITAMHDPTEGGIINGIFELCNASAVGADFYKERIPVADETLKLCEIFNIDPLRLISSGTLLMTVNPIKGKLLLKKLISQGINATCIGKIKREKEITFIRRNGTTESIFEQNQDQLWEI